MQSLPDSQTSTSLMTSTVTLREYTCDAMHIHALCMHRRLIVPKMSAKLQIAASTPMNKSNCTSYVQFNVAACYVPCTWRDNWIMALLTKADDQQRPLHWNCRLSNRSRRFHQWPKSAACKWQFLLYISIYFKNIYNNDVVSLICTKVFDLTQEVKEQITIQSKTTSKGLLNFKFHAQQSSV